MDKLLPVVCKDVALSTIEDVKKENRKKLSEIIEIIKEENPEIAVVIIDTASVSADKSGVLFASLLVYQMLRCQSEVDMLNSE